MSSTQVEPFGLIDNAEWFMNLTPRKQKKAEKKLAQAIHDVVDWLGGKLALPQTIRFHFANEPEAGDLAYAFISSVFITESGFELMHETPDIFRGTIAHELSHLSDELMVNDCTFVDEPFHNLIAEGKADYIAVGIGGKEFEDELCSELYNEEKAIIYPKLYSGVDADLDIYDVGLSVVRDVVWASGRNIYEIHPEPTSYFLQVLEELVQKGSA